MGPEKYPTLKLALKKRIPEILILIPDRLASGNADIVETDGGWLARWQMENKDDDGTITRCAVVIETRKQEEGS